ncbi:hypothetical protein M3Y99_00914600 [Aphelenchoides fujianensis]|nr:hypothetical protein M3Y99_01082700 [Aphelenchoides fujianensis]KAI6233456.1 hypothetical protein M3Y99_00914600 [Aphelenchoides fujianensis]
MFYKLEDDVVHKPANTTTTTIVRPAEREVAVRVKVEDDDSDGSSNESEGVGDREGRCLICGYLCSNSNYGCKACNACAAFFRRTIKQSRSYVCPRGKNCRVDFGGHKRTCRYCRFQRCVAVGMSVHYVLTKHHSHQSVPAIIDPTPTDIEDVLFRRLTESFGGTFVHRFHAKSRAYEWCGISLRRSNSSLLNTTHSMFAEFEVMLRYLRASGICKYLNGREELAKLCARLFYPWVFINGCWSTLRNGGHRINTIFFADESSVRVSRDAAEEYLRPIPQLRNSDYVASSLATLHHKAINAGVKFYTLNMDSTDFAFICQIITLHFG